MKKTVKTKKLHSYLRTDLKVGICFQRLEGVKGVLKAISPSAPCRTRRGEKRGGRGGEGIGDGRGEGRERRE
jgi:hypothetical protein